MWANKAVIKAVPLQKEGNFLEFFSCTMRSLANDTPLRSAAYLPLHILDVVEGEGKGHSSLFPVQGETRTTIQ